MENPQKVKESLITGITQKIQNLSNDELCDVLFLIWNIQQRRKETS